MNNDATNPTISGSRNIIPPWNSIPTTASSGWVRFKG